jgi:prolyl 4-hydroxylase
MADVNNRYTDSQQFRKHTDWLDPEIDEGVELYGNRESSFFVYLLANCTGGTTVFTNVFRPKAEEWCDALICEDENGEEVEWLEVKPRVGTAIFWWNLDPDGVGDDNTMHAGTPVINGTKVGLNIWTRERQWRQPQ